MPGMRVLAEEEDKARVQASSYLSPLPKRKWRSCLTKLLVISYSGQDNSSRPVNIRAPLPEVLPITKMNPRQKGWLQ